MVNYTRTKINFININLFIKLRVFPLWSLTVTNVILYICVLALNHSSQPVRTQNTKLFHISILILPPLHRHRSLITVTAGALSDKLPWPTLYNHRYKPADNPFEGAAQPSDPVVVGVDHFSRQRSERKIVHTARQPHTLCSLPMWSYIYTYYSTGFRVPWRYIYIYVCMINGTPVIGNSIVVVPYSPGNVQVRERKIFWVGRSKPPHTLLLICSSRDLIATQYCHNACMAKNYYIYRCKCNWKKKLRNKNKLLKTNYSKTRPLKHFSPSWYSSTV